MFKWISFGAVVLFIVLAAVKVGSVAPPPEALVFVIDNTIYPPSRTAANDARAVRTTWGHARRAGNKPYDPTGFNVERSLLNAIFGAPPDWCDSGEPVQLGTD